MKMNKNRAIWVLAAVLLAAVAVRLSVGGLPDAPVLLLRLARVRSCVIVGVALATSGVALQVLLRNPLAEPFILGLSSGAGVGVIAQSLVWFALFGRVGSGSLGALLGAAASMMIVFAAARRHGMIDPLGLLLVGVVLSTINGALILLLNYVAGPGGVKEQLSLWMMGYISENVAPHHVWLIAAITAAALGLLIGLSRAMDVATFSDAEAQSLGVNLGQLRTLLFFVASVLAAGAVVLAGPVAFVGLISPHLTRLLVGPTHRRLLIGSAMVGATLLLAADAAGVGLGRRFNVGVMPLGIFTAMLGGPVFLWMLRPYLGRQE